METFLRDIAAGLVGDPTAVSVERSAGEAGEVILKLNVADIDKGLVIGKHGKVAKAIRTVVRAGACAADSRYAGKNGTRVTINID